MAGAGPALQSSQYLKQEGNADKGGMGGGVQRGPWFMVQQMPPCTNVLILNKTDSFLSDTYVRRQKSCWGNALLFECTLVSSSPRTRFLLTGNYVAETL